MTRALFKKQMMEIFSFVFHDKKTGKKRTVKGLIGYSALFLYLFGFLGFTFYQVADSLCAPLADAGLLWLYVAIMSLISAALGVFGSIFNTYASLYRARDNDLLLAMPIPARSILLVRLFGVYLMGLLYELLVFVPALIVLFQTVRLTVRGALFALLLPLLLSALVLALSCLLGFVVAIISAKCRFKNALTIVFSLGFIVGYYYLYAKAYKLLLKILENPTEVGKRAKGVLYPFYCLGRAAEGDVVSFLLAVLMFGGLLVLTYLVLAKSFLSLATANKGGSKTQKKTNLRREGSVRLALLKKELRRFVGSPVYFLNCGLGCILIPVAAVFLLVKASAVREILPLFAMLDIPVLLVAAALACTMISMNDMTAPSVSLEGKHIWLLQSMPVPARLVLQAKLTMQLLLTLPLVLFLGGALIYVLSLSAADGVLLIAVLVLYTVLLTLWGLFLNLKFPNLHWTQEVVPVKQSLSVTMTLLGGWAFVTMLGVIYYFLRNTLDADVYLFLVLLLFVALILPLYLFINKKGSKIFETLS